MKIADMSKERRRVRTVDGKTGFVVVDFNNGYMSVQVNGKYVLYRADELEDVVKD